MGTAQTDQLQANGRFLVGVVGSDLMGPFSRREVKNSIYSQSRLERRAIEGDGPVGEMYRASLIRHPSTTGHVEPCGNLGGPSPKAKYYPATDSEQVP
jgi:hypothetical protein